MDFEAEQALAALAGRELLAPSAYMPFVDRHGWDGLRHIFDAYEAPDNTLTVAVPEGGPVSATDTGQAEYVLESFWRCTQHGWTLDDWTMPYTDHQIKMLRSWLPIIAGWQMVDKPDPALPAAVARQLNRYSFPRVRNELRMWAFAESRIEWVRSFSHLDWWRTLAERLDDGIIEHDQSILLNEKSSRHTQVTQFENTTISLKGFKLEVIGRSGELILSVDVTRPSAAWISRGYVPIDRLAGAPFPAMP